MMNNYDYAIGMGAPAWIHVFGPALALLVLWSIFWKGLALWHSAQRGEHVWFIVMLILNTAGILEIIYLFLVKKIPASELLTSHVHPHDHHEHHHSH